MLRKIKIPLIFLILILILIGLKMVWPGSENNVKGGREVKSVNEAVIVQAVIVESQAISDRLYLSGSLAPSERIDIFPEISGRVMKLSLKEGAFVQKGDVLVRIQDAELQAQLRSLEAKTDLAKQQEIRLKKLLNIQGVSRDEYDAVYYQLKAFEADADLIKAQIDKTKIQAPFSGTIGLKYISEGAIVNPSTRIASLQQNKPVKLDFAIPEKYAAQVGPGYKVKFTLQSGSKVYTAKVFATETQVDALTRTLPVRAVCEQNDAELIPGAFARIELVLDEDEAALMIPTTAIIPILKGQQVYRVRNGQAEAIQVLTGLRTEKEIQIISGISEGDTIITTGIMSLRPGMPVQVSLHSGKN